MSATLYDKALMSKINAWTEKSKLQVFGPTEARQRLAVLADINDDKSIKLPFLVLSRPEGYVINNSLKRPMTYNGKHFTHMTSQEAGGKIVQLNAIPITLQYELNVYTRYEQEADAYMRELIFNFVNYPALDVLIPYLNASIIHESTVRFATDTVGINRGSVSIKSDQVFNYGIDLKIDDAYLWDVRAKDPIQIADSWTLSYENPNGSVTYESINGGIIKTEDPDE